jgi:carbon-monoxide dehydrogenase large subunit
VQHRHQNVPMETRGSVSSFDPGTRQLTVWSACQGVNVVRTTLAAKLELPVESVRVHSEDVGGSFGLKMGASREDIACAAASMQLGRPVKWVEDRYEHMAASGQAREETFDVAAAVTNEGDILGLRVHITVDTGAYPAMGHMVGRAIMAMIPGPYKIGALACDVTAAVTNKASYVAYRGPWAGETWLRERIIDLVARELGREPIEIRLRNVVTRDEEPTTMITGRSLEGVTARESLERAAELLDVPAFRERQAAARAEGRYLGLGCATFIEPAPGPDPAAGGRARPEQMNIELADDGTVVVYTGQMPHGQGTQTTAAQIVADELGVRFEDVRVVIGDTELVPAGFTGGSRSATMTGGAARHTARAMRARVLEVASHLLEASPADLELSDGKVAVRGVPARGMTLAEVVAAAREPGRLPDDVDAALAVEGAYDGGRGGWSGGTHCAQVEVDIETGLVAFERYVVVEDCGELINPAVVDGQVRGGVAQGIGAVLLERSAYDDQGQFLSSTFMDYLLPTSMEIPRIQIDHLATVPLDPDVNFRGVGEGGMIVTPAAVNNAIEDALAPLGVRVHEQHLPPTRLVEMVREAAAG